MPLDTYTYQVFGSSIRGGRGLRVGATAHIRAKTFIRIPMYKIYVTKKETTHMNHKFQHSLMYVYKIEAIGRKDISAFCMYAHKSLFIDEVIEVHDIIGDKYCFMDEHIYTFGRYKAYKKE